MKHFIVLLCAVALSLLAACNSKPSFKIGKMYNGFKLVEKRFVKEVDAECLYFIHEKSGARLLKIKNSDTNKLFGIAFKTIPEDDCGTPHILEHSVLNGSKNFPVKSPFDQLLQGSLNTFLNAMTNSDWTVYPVASMNDKDYFNLMHVYLDAVFNPLIYSDKRILMQEGWHYELADANANVEYKGVVYNEMKGAYSNPQRELYYQRSKLLFPDNGYGKDSGGYPSAIPTLTYEKFIEFHQKYYHPSNSYIMLYGNADLAQELAFIDEAYLSGYTQSDKTVSIPLQPAFDTMKTEVREYAIQEGEETQNKTFLGMSIVAGLNSNQKLTWALNILAEALVNHEQGPVRRALLEAEIGQNVDGWLDDTQQNVFEIMVQNANADQQKQFNDIVMNTFKQVVAEGLDQAIVEGIVNRIEFAAREGNTPQKGLVYFLGTLRGWMFTQNPFAGLEYETMLAELKKDIKNGYLETVIQEYLIDNNHKLSLALVPKPGLQNLINQQTEAELATYKASLTPSQTDSLVAETKALIDYQRREDPDSLKAKIPSLNLSDIGTEAEWYDAVEKKGANTTILHCNEFANGIVYANLYFDTRVIDTNNTQWVQLLSELLSKMPTANYTFGDLENAMNSKTGSFNTSFMWYIRERNDHHILPKLRVSSKAMRDKTGDMTALMAEIISNTNYNDYVRLKELITRHQSDIDNAIKQNGLGVARSRLFSYFSNEGMLQEKKGGLEYYRFITDLAKNFDTQKETIAHQLAETAKSIFTLQNLIAATTCSDEDYPLFESALSQVTQVLPNHQMPLTQLQFDLNPKNEGLLSSSKVQYVLQGANYKQLGYEWNGHLQVLEQLLSTDYLQTHIRVIGGAYGGFIRFSPTGNMFMGSYRDPNLKETFDNFAGIPQYLDSLKLDEKAVSRFIIGTIANIDQPLTASQKGDRAFTAHFTGSSKQLLQKEREQILSTTVTQLKAFAPMMKDVLKLNIRCVYGNDEKLKANSHLFDQLVQVAL
jgi:presequence protease